MAPTALRVSDAERNDVIAALCRHFADGRLDEEEFNERQARAGAAKTHADLAPLLADLPRLGAMTPATRPHRPRARYLIAALVLVTLAASAVSSVSHLLHPHVPWALIVVGVFCLVSWQRHTSHRR